MYKENAAAECVCIIIIMLMSKGQLLQSLLGAKCSSVVRAFAHGVMDHRIDPSWG